MTENDGGDEAARAFEDLRGEVILLRRAVERLAAERAGDGDAPDYSETLHHRQQRYRGRPARRYAGEQSGAGAHACRQTAACS